MSSGKQAARDARHVSGHGTCVGIDAAFKRPVKQKGR